MSISESLRQRTYAFLRTPRNERDVSILEFRHINHIGKDRWKTLQLDFEAYERDQATKLERIQEMQKGLYEEIKEEVEGPVDDIDDYMARKDVEMVKAIFSAGQKGNATSQGLWAKMRKWIEEKPQETNVYINQFALEAARELERERTGNGVAEVPPERPLLRSEICVDTGQGEEGNNQV